jgi:hypothetical protein
MKALAWFAVGGGGLLAFTKLRTGGWNPLKLFEKPSDPVAFSAFLAKASPHTVHSALLQSNTSWVASNTPGTVAVPIETSSVASAPVQVTGSPIPVETGATYFVTATTSGAAASMANAAKIQQEAENRGFRDVQVYKTAPPDWPGSTGGDWYVVGTYSRDSTSVDRSYGNFLGKVNLVDVWSLS